MYVDTSALVALYIPEPKSEAVQQAVSSASEACISTLCEVELASAVSRRVRMGELRAVDGRRVLSTFQLHVGKRLYRVVPLWQQEYNLAKEWLGRFETPLRTLDAIHLGVAFSNQLPLLTADRVLADAAHEFGIVCHLV